MGRTPQLFDVKAMRRHLNTPFRKENGRPIGAYRLYMVGNTIYLGWKYRNNHYPTVSFSDDDHMHVVGSTAFMSVSFRNALHSMGLLRFFGRIGRNFDGRKYPQRVFWGDKDTCYLINENLEVHMRTAEVIKGDIAEPKPKIKTMAVDMYKRQKFMRGVRSIRLMMKAIDRCDPISDHMPRIADLTKYYIGRCSKMAMEFPIEILATDIDNGYPSQELISFCSQFYGYSCVARTDVFNRLLKARSVDVRTWLGVLTKVNER